MRDKKGRLKMGMGGDLKVGALLGRSKKTYVLSYILTLNFSYAIDCEATAKFGQLMVPRGRGCQGLS